MTALSIPRCCAGEAVATQDRRFGLLYAMSRYRPKPDEHSEKPGTSSELLVSRVRSLGGFHRHGQVCWLAIVISSSIQPQMSTEVRNWAIVAKAMEAAGATSSQMYVRAKALAQGKLDPMPTSAPEAPYSISAA